MTRIKCIYKYYAYIYCITVCGGLNRAVFSHGSSIIILCYVMSPDEEEEARRQRQAQQRLQKEQWKRKHGLGRKRRSEGEIGLSAGGGDGGGEGDELGLISDGEGGLFAWQLL